jgi:hypothetical protein
VVTSIAEDAATAVIWPAIIFKPAPIRGVSSASGVRAASGATSTEEPAHDGAGEEWVDAPAAFNASAVVEDDSGPPLDALEAQMRTEIASREGPQAAPVRVKTAAEPEDALTTLPELEELLSRIPPEVRDTVDELFRVRFQTVRQVPGKALVALNGKSVAS